MTLTDYNSKVANNFKDKRVINKTHQLLKKIVEHKTIRLWTLSDDKKEFDRNKRLIDNSLQSVLDEKKISEALIKHSVAKLQGNKRLYIFSDHSDSRKPYSKELENLGKVRDLNGNIKFNGVTARCITILINFQIFN